MELPPTPDQSLYELAFSVEEAAPPLQISPSTLKSMVASVMDTLIEHQIPATVLVKLPRKDAWHSEIDQYSNLLDVPHAVYYLEKELDGEEVPSEAAIAPSPDLTLLMPRPDHSPRLAIPIAAESALRREYFLIVLAEHFCSCVLAHRPRSMQAIADPLSALGDFGDYETDSAQSQRKQPLLALCSFDPALVKVILAGCQSAFAAVPAIALETGQPTPVQVATEPLLNHWDEIFPVPAAVDPNLLNLFFTKQVRHQEDLWRRIVAYRRQTDAIEALQRQNEELLNTIRLKDEFLNNVSQELRTPLTNMKTALTLLNSPNLKPSQRQRYMQVLNKECDHQGSLISGLLDLIRLDQPATLATVQPMCLSDVVPGVVSTYQPLAQEKGIMLAYTAPDNLPPVACLAIWMKQIVINLLHNGIKFTPRGGQVWVQAKLQGEYVQLEFRDSGIGIPPSEIHKIFDRFYRGRQATEDGIGGAGLGLTIVQQLLLRCGGSISVKSRLGEGTTFNVLLPIYHGGTDVDLSPEPLV